MPEVRTYTVTQERSVKVSAENPLDAARLADLAFRDIHSDNPGLGRVASNVEVTSINVNKDY